LDKRLQARDNKWDFRVAALESRVEDSERVTFLPIAAAGEKTLDASFVSKEVHDHFSGKTPMVSLEGIDGVRRSKIHARKVCDVGALESRVVGFAQHRDGCSSAIRADIEAHLSAAALQSTGARATALQSALHVFDARRPEWSRPWRLCTCSKTATSLNNSPEPVAASTIPPPRSWGPASIQMAELQVAPQAEQFMQQWQAGAKYSCRTVLASCLMKCPLASGGHLAASLRSPYTRSVTP
jgi:hypothetical protein